ncbi:AAA family ATPase [Candidatus Woesearchaeota archaeon]|nr:AAA family ATPase [Candidatus Woesearchaeota archaeon]
MKVFVVTGTTGTGKTEYAKKYALENKCVYIDVNKIIKEHNLSEGYDEERHCHIIDVEKLNKALTELIEESKEDLVIDSHLAHFLPKEYVSQVFVTKCNLKELKKRLEARDYSKKKIRENLDAEIFDVCLNEAKELGHKIKIIRTDKKEN